MAGEAVWVGNDHGGVELKAAIITRLEELGLSGEIPTVTE